MKKETINSRQEKWEKIRKDGRIKFALVRAFYIAGIISVLGFLFVYFTGYRLKVSYEKFALILFSVMFLYKFLKNYFIDWPMNEKRYKSEG